MNRMDATIEQEEKEIHIDQPILKKVQNEKEKKIVMVWFDNRKINDIIPQIWIIDYLEMYDIFDKVMNFIQKAMKNSKMELTVGVKSFTEVKIQSVTTQGNAHSPYLFVIGLIPLSHTRMDARNLLNCNKD